MSRRVLPLLLALSVAPCSALNLNLNLATPKPLDWMGQQGGAGLRFVVADFESKIELRDEPVTVPKPDQARVPDSRVEAERSTKDKDGDAITLRWQQAWYAALRLESTHPKGTADLRPFLNGTLEFDVKVTEASKGGFSVAIGCGTDCYRKVNYVLPSRALQGQGWQHLAFSMRCFARPKDNFSRVTQPFVLEGSGTAEVAVANIRFRRDGKGTAACPDPRTVAVTPSPLNQVWSLDWWMPRHEAKLAEVRDRQAKGEKIDLVFIGDSITEGWEKDGSKVWDEVFVPRGGLALGFGGDKTENVLWRLQHGEVDGLSPKTVVLHIGTNNTGDRQDEPEVTAAGIRAIVQELRQRLPGARILVLSIFPRDELPNSHQRRRNEAINTLIAGLTDANSVEVLNINARLMRPDGSLSRDVFPDLLHLSEAGYRLWAEALLPHLNR